MGARIPGPVTEEEYERLTRRTSGKHIVFNGGRQWLQHKHGGLRGLWRWLWLGCPRTGKAAEAADEQLPTSTCFVARCGCGAVTVAGTLEALAPEHDDGTTWPSVAVALRMGGTVHTCTEEEARTLSAEPWQHSASCRAPGMALLYLHQGLRSEQAASAR